MSEIINSLPVLNQIYIKKWASFGVSYLGNDLYFLKEFIDIFIQDFGEERFVEALKNDNSRNKEKIRYFGEHWNQVKCSLNYINWFIAKSKGFYDKVQNSEFSKINDNNVKDFFFYCNKIPLTHKYIYPLAVFCLAHSSIQARTIKSEDWKVLEHLGLKKVDATARKPQSLSTPHEPFGTAH